MGTSHTPSVARQVSMMKPTASSLSMVDVGAGRSAPSRPLSPCTYAAYCGGATSGRTAPLCTGTDRPSRSFITNALYVVDSIGALPDTDVMPSRSV